MKISKQDLENLKKIRETVQKLEDAQSFLCDLAEDITKETGDYGYTFDYVFNDMDLEVLLDILEIEVESV